MPGCCVNCVLASVSGTSGTVSAWSAGGSRDAWICRVPAWSTRFTSPDCVFEEIDLRKARAEKSLAWVGERGARIAAIIADEFESDAGLTVAGVTVAGVISLHWANVRGDLRLTNSHLMPQGGQAIAGRDVRVGGTLFMDGPDFHAEGEVCLRSAHVKGDINCRHARFDNPSGRSIDGDHLIVDGEILLQGYHDDTLVPSHYGMKEDFHSDGEVCLQWAQVHRLRATGGKFANPSGFALHADALHAKDGVYLDRGFKATAEVRLVGAYITGELCCTKGTFENPIGLALNAERIEADDVYPDRGFTAKGQVRFTDAQVKRQFNATGGDFRNDRAGEYALDADGLVCGGEVFLNEGFHAVGAVSLTGAEIHSELNCTAGSFRNPDGYALFADGLPPPAWSTSITASGRSAKSASPERQSAASSSAQTAPSTTSTASRSISPAWCAKGMSC